MTSTRTFDIRRIVSDFFKEKKRIFIILLYIVISALLVYFFCIAITWAITGNVTGRVIETLSPSDYSTANNIPKSIGGDNSEPANKEAVQDNNIGLPGVIITSVPIECSPWENFFYPTRFYTGDTTSDDQGNFSYHFSPCIHAFFSKPGYQRLEQSHKNSAANESSQNIISFQKKIGRAYIAIDPDEVHTNSKFKYTVLFYSKTGERVFLTPHVQSFCFTDPFQTSFSSQNAPAIEELHQEVDTKDFRGQANATMKFFDNSNMLLAKVEKCFPVSEPITTETIFSKIPPKEARANVQNIDNILHFKKSIPTIIFNKFDTISPHGIGFTYQFHENTITFIVQFMGFEFIFGTMEQTAVEIRDIETQTIVYTATIASKLTSDTDITIAITYTPLSNVPETSNEEKTGDGLHELNEDKFNIQITMGKTTQLIPLKLSPSRLKIALRKTFPAKFFFINSRLAPDPGKQRETNQIAISSFTFY